MAEQDYPTNTDIKKIVNWPYDDFKGLISFIYTIWHYADCGYWTKRGNKYYISTGGWSGNEEIIGAMQKNKQFFWTMCWYQSRRGGHYIFHVR